MIRNRQGEGHGVTREKRKRKKTCMREIVLNVRLGVESEV